jgi:glucose-6-phosphate 1-dehydrogenase
MDIVKKKKVVKCKAGSYGPKEADALLEKEGRRWIHEDL